MKSITDLETRNQLLASWRGTHAKIWLFHVTHMKLALCLSRRKEREAIYVIATGCRGIRGPFSWESADISITREGSDQHKASRYIVADGSAGFELVCDSVSVVHGIAFVPANPFRDFSTKDSPHR